MSSRAALQVPCRCNRCSSTPDAFVYQTKQVVRKHQAADQRRLLIASQAGLGLVQELIDDPLPVRALSVEDLGPHPYFPDDDWELLGPQRSPSPTSSSRWTLLAPGGPQDALVQAAE
ncbi:hypothetical protein BDZ94DRAFT_1310885, partial [Collybia nuda]